MRVTCNSGSVVYTGAAADRYPFGHSTVGPSRTETLPCCPETSLVLCVVLAWPQLLSEFLEGRVDGEG